MKKIMSVLLATLMLASTLAVLAVPASAAGSSFYVNAWDPAEFVQGTAAIYTTTDCGEGWACHAAFAPTGEKDVWKLVSYSSSEGGAGVAQEVPKGGFVWTVIWIANDENIDGAMKSITALNGCVGKSYKITGLDLANKTCASDATIEMVLAKDEFYATVINPTGPIGVEGVIYIGQNTNNGWWTQVAFKPVEGKANVYEAVEVIWADGSKATVPEGGFVWAIHSGCLIQSVRDQIKTIGEAIGAEGSENLYTIKGIDVANKTIKNPTLKVYVEGDENVTETPDDNTQEGGSTPDTGDASSMVIFGLIALVSMAGAAVVVKNRR